MSLIIMIFDASEITFMLIFISFDRYDFVAEIWDKVLFRILLLLSF